MRLVDEIIELASDDQKSVSVLLRKCLILAHRLKNDRLKTWAENELNGYGPEEEVPEYRKTVITAKGFFVGPMGAQIHDQPLTASVLKPEHRHWALTAVLRQPIVAYEGADAQGDSPRIEWPAHLTVRYQTKFFADYVLNRAWQEIPSSTLVGLVDTVKTRVLRLALELYDELGQVSDEPDRIPSGKVDRSVVNNIFGGSNIIAGSAHDFTQIGGITVQSGDLASLQAALRRLGVKDDALAELEGALAGDAEHNGGVAAYGQLTAAWLKRVGVAVGSAGLSMAADVAKAEATRWILQYLGLS